MLLLQKSFASSIGFLIRCFSSLQIYKIFQVEMSIYNNSTTPWALWGDNAYISH